MDNKDQKRNISVAVDGPSGSGKSTLSRAAAKELSLVYVDTGAIYRTTALHILRRGADPRDAAAVAALLPEVGITLSYDVAGMQRMCLNGEDVTELIRTQEVSMAASTVSAYPAVRAFLLEMQRELARRHSVIMDGRDIGTVVLPEADVKIFLTAGSEIRARRRWLELQERGTPRDWEQLLRETRERDEKDANRAESPLRPAADSVLLDTSELDFAQSLRRIIEIIRERTGS
ncbi:MAG: (d)CMP kinase [Oscillospiraceae bacterium]|jgi:cytidylate kinase|nr:(d)CMP kinase [Oscillospiraceae bacterium]